MDEEYRKYFPAFVDLKEKNVLIAGAGKIAVRRAAVLTEFGACVKMVAPKIYAQAYGHMQNVSGDTFILETRHGKIWWIKRPFAESDLDGCDLVIAATSDGMLNGRIVRLCKKRRILVNHAGDKSQCDFYFPAIAYKDELVIGVTSSGINHGKVQTFTAKLREWLASW